MTGPLARPGGQGGVCTCVLVSNQPRNRGMADALAARTGCRFVLIADPAELTAARLSALNPRFVFVPHWSRRIEPAIHEQFECVIFHMTDLPFGRGGSPLQNLIVRGIQETKISAIRCVEEMDAGPIYLKRPLSLQGSAEEIFQRAGGAIEDMIVELIEKRPEPVPQQGTPTVFKRRMPQDGDLALATSLREAFDLIRMLDAEGYPRAFLKAGPFRLEFSRATMGTGSVASDVRISLSEKPEGDDKP